MRRTLIALTGYRHESGGEQENCSAAGNQVVRSGVESEGNVSSEASSLSRNLLARAVRMALLAATDLDEIIVTGSRIRGSEPVGSSVTSLSRENIDLAAPLTTASLLQKLPQVFNIGVSE